MTKYETIIGYQLTATVPIHLHNYKSNHYRSKSLSLSKLVDQSSRPSRSCYTNPRQLQISRHRRRVNVFVFPFHECDRPLVSLKYTASSAYPIGSLGPTIEADVSILTLTPAKTSV